MLVAVSALVKTMNVNLSTVSKTCSGVVDTPKQVVVSPNDFFVSFFVPANESDLLERKFSLSMLSSQLPCFFHVFWLYGSLAVESRFRRPKTRLRLEISDLFDRNARQNYNKDHLAQQLQL